MAYINYFDQLDDLLEELKEDDYPYIYTNIEYGDNYVLNLQNRKFTITQCYQEDHPYRKDLPPYWFIFRMMNKDETKEPPYLISCYGNKLTWLIGHQNEDDYGYMMTKLYDKSGNLIQNKKIMLHNMFSVIFEGESYVTPKAKKNISEEGIHSFGVEKGKNQTHHKNIDKYDNNPNNLETVTDSHKVLHDLRSGKDIPLEEVGEAISDEMLGGAGIILSGGKYNKYGELEEKGDSAIYDLGTFMKKSGSKNFVFFSKDLYDSCQTDEEREYLINLANSIHKISNM